MKPQPLSPIHKIKALLINESTYNLLLFYFLSSIIYSFTFLTYLSIFEYDSNFTPFFNHKRRGWQFNERFIFVILNSIFLSLIYTLNQLWNDRFLTKFSSNTQSTISVKVKQSLKANIPLSLKLSLISTLTFLSSYLILRKPLYKSIATFTLSTFRPHLFSLLRQNNVSFGLVLRSIIINIGIVCSWEVTNTLFDIYSVHPILISKISQSPNNCLLNGIKSSDDYYRHFAYLEFLHVFSTDSQRRKEVYKDIHRHQSAWSELSNAAIEQINKGNSRSKDDKSIEQSILKKDSNLTPTTITSNTTKMHINSDSNIYKRQSRSPINNLIEEISINDTTTKSTIPSIFKTNNSVIKDNNDENVNNNKNVEDYNSIGLDRLFTFLPNDITNMIRISVNGDETSIMMTGVHNKIPEIDLITLSSLGLSYLTSASINEDSFGLVQHDIPKVIESITKTLIAFENLENELKTKCSNPTKSLKFFRVYIQQLRDSLSIILFAFKDFIDTFQLDFQTLNRVNEAIKML